MELAQLWQIRGSRLEKTMERLHRDDLERRIGIFARKTFRRFCLRIRQLAFKGVKRTVFVDFQKIHFAFVAVAPEVELCFVLSITMPFEPLDDDKIFPESSAF